MRKELMEVLSQGHEGPFQVDKCLLDKEEEYPWISEDDLLIPIIQTTDYMCGACEVSVFKTRGNGILKSLLEIRLHVKEKSFSFRQCFFGPYAQYHPTVEKHEIPLS
jgi:hypothetical protein